MFASKSLWVLCSALLLGACSPKQESSPPSTNNASSAQLNTNKTYIVATDASYAPMEYIEYDKIVGFSHDILDSAAKTQNIKLEFVNVPFEGLFANLDQSDSDIALASITINDERKKQLDFSDPYFQATQMIVTTQSMGKDIHTFADLKNRTASVQTATSGDLILQKLQGTKSTLIKRFETMSLAFKELENHGVDAVVGDSSVVEYYAKQNPNAKLNLIVDKSFEQEHYGFAFKKGRNDGLRDAINAGLKQIKTNGTYDKIYQQWFGNQNKTAASATH